MCSSTLVSFGIGSSRENISLGSLCLLHSRAELSALFSFFLRQNKVENRPEEEVIKSAQMKQFLRLRTATKIGRAKLR